jgi:hypothetical protein
MEDIAKEAYNLENLRFMWENRLMQQYWGEENLDPWQTWQRGGDVNPV